MRLAAGGGGCWLLLLGCVGVFVVAEDPWTATGVRESCHVSSAVWEKGLSHSLSVWLATCLSI
jgi:hypothetical protein